MPAAHCTQTQPLPASALQHFGLLKLAINALKHKWIYTHAACCCNPFPFPLPCCMQEQGIMPSCPACHSHPSPFPLPSPRGHMRSVCSTRYPVSNCFEGRSHVFRDLFNTSAKQMELHMLETKKIKHENMFKTNRNGTFSIPT